MFFGSIFFSFVLTITSFFYQNCQYLVMSVAFTSSICCLLLDFFINLVIDNNRYIFIGIFIALAFLLFILASCFPKFSFTLYTSCTGSIIAVINFAVVSNYINSFQTFNFSNSNIIEHLMVLGSAILVGTGMGIIIQCCMTKSKKRIKEGCISQAGNLEKTVVS